MTRVAGPTTFVTGAAGFVGTELVKLLVSRGHSVFGLARSPEAGDRVRRAGGTPVVGNLLEPGMWQDEAAAAAWVFHLPPHPMPRCRLTSKFVASTAAARLAIDAHLLDALATGAARRIVYLADANCYSARESRAMTEDELVTPSAWGEAFVPALERIDGHVVCGLPIITAMSGCIYGHGSWFGEHIVAPILAGHRVLEFGMTGGLVSPIHVHDCARALVHLAQHGGIGRRYFVVNSNPVMWTDFAVAFARAANRPLRISRLPAASARFFIGPVWADRLRSNAVLSNVRLRGTGFRFVYPTLDQGLQQIFQATGQTPATLTTERR